jgi:hypothetical protein
MFLLFGLGKQTIKEMGNTDSIQCGRCNNVNPWKYRKYSTWFTLFFIPVIPYKNMYVKECPICKAAVKVDKDEAMGNVIDSPSDIAADDSVDTTPNDGLTEVQRNYRIQMDASKKANEEASKEANEEEEEL